MWLRGNESGLASITAGNGASTPYAAAAYVHVDAVMGHDLSFPFNIVKRGRRAVYVPGARATEKMVPTIEGEGARKRRMMSHAWAIVLRGGLLDPRGYSPLYALMLLSHRLLRYGSPLLHLAAAAATLALLREGPGTARRRSRRWGCSPARRRARACGSGRCCSPATTSRRRPPSARASTTTCATGRPRCGRRPRARGELRGQARPRRRRRGLDAHAQRPGARGRRRLIRIESHGHPIYRQRRVGRDGAPFELYKLRTMVAGAESIGPGLALAEGDARITRLGRCCGAPRSTSCPTSSTCCAARCRVVGPRPTVQVQVDRYSERQRGRLAVKPGLTGWAQVQGRASLPWGERIELDLWYVEHESLRLDLHILWRTVRTVLHGGGLYKGETGGWRDPPR